MQGKCPFFNICLHLPKVVDAYMSLFVTVDVLPPVVTFCPMDIVVNADPNLNGLFVNWMTPTAADNVELSPDVVITGGNPNTFFPVGVAIITYTFSDIFENTVDCVFMVEVVGKHQLFVFKKKLLLRVNIVI